MTKRNTAVPYVVAAVMLFAAVALALLEQGTTEQALASLTRHTARIAFLLFFVTFTASVWFTWRVTPLTGYLMRNRRHLGLAFAAVHFVHLAMLTSLLLTRGEAPDAVTLVGGGLAYVLLTLLVATSNRAARRRLGRGWRALHLTGCWYLWLIFTQSYLGRMATGTEPYAAFVTLSALALSVPVLRLWAWSRRRGRLSRPTAGAVPP